ncbi:MAG: hypothetical protein ACI9GH_000446 [Candidatus Paceibacteria bacterium]|jgi:hypothetical protein
MYTSTYGAAKDIVDAINNGKALDKIVLKTIFPSRKATEKYLK